MRIVLKKSQQSRRRRRRAKCINYNSRKLIILQLKTAGIKMLLINFCGCRSAKQGLFLCTILLSLLASGTSRYRYERPSRVVEIKQGRLQGTLVEVPLLSTVTSSSVKTQVIHIISLLLSLDWLPLLTRYDFRNEIKIVFMLGNCFGYSKHLIFHFVY